MSTHVVQVNGASVTVRADENLLDACLRSAVSIPFSCRGGVCQTCLLRCTEGAVPAGAQRGLPPGLRDKGYLLACQCRPEGPMTLAPPSGADRMTACVLLDVIAAGPFLHVQFETMRALPCRPGDRLRLLEGCSDAPDLVVTRWVESADRVEVLWRRTGQAEPPPWLTCGMLGHEFTVAGPLDAPAPDGEGEEISQPEPDPALWAELGDGRVVRDALEDFYARVYRDPQLSPFFLGVTLTRSVDKQYSFLRQLMTGERVYFGDRPRNAHHWMVISGDLFDHRQALMQATLRTHGLRESQIARWTRLELHYRGDIVKVHARPRRLGGQDLPLQGHDRQVLDVGTVCDHCGKAIDAHTEVTYHRRLGLVSCNDCAGEMA